MIAANFQEGRLVEREDIIGKRCAGNDAGKLGTHCVCVLQLTSSQYLYHWSKSISVTEGFVQMSLLIEKKISLAKSRQVESELSHVGLSSRSK